MDFTSIPEKFTVKAQKTFIYIFECNIRPTGRDK